MNSITIEISDEEIVAIEIKNPFSYSHFISTKLRDAGIPIKATFGFDVTVSLGTISQSYNPVKGVTVYRWEA